MSSNVFPLTETESPAIDSAFSDRKDALSCVVTTSGHRRERRAEVLTRGRRFSAISFKGDSGLYSAYAVDTLGVRPRPVSALRTVDAVRHPDFAGITNRKRPFTIILPPVPELPDLSGAKEAWQTLTQRFGEYGENLSVGMSGFRLGITPKQRAYAPLVGAMALGMVSALALEHAFGGGAQAEEAKIVYVERSETRSFDDEAFEKSVFDTEQLLAELAAEDPDKQEFEERIRKMVEGYPIEDMISEIVEQDRTVAMFLVAIAKKESNWGKRVPVLKGQDCYNYWGYRGIRKMMGTGGHTCFNSRADAVKTVGKRLETLIHEYDLDTPEELILWKCGSSCAGHSSYSVRKWIADVDLYYGKLNEG